MSSVSKITAQRNQRILLELVLKPGNDICADCKARAPRWASYNLGIFICVSCASIHRKIGTHVTKVKSITLDEWSKEQVEVMKENGNIKSNALYNPNEARHPPPTNMIDSERDSELEKFIRSKYEFKRFMDRKSGFTSQQPPSELRALSTRSRSTPLTDLAPIWRRSSPGPPPPPKTPENLPPGLRYSATTPSLLSHPPPARSVSQPLPPMANTEKPSAAPPLRQHPAIQPSLQKPAGQVWEDLVSLEGPSGSSSLPLQYSPVAPAVPFSSQQHVPVQQQPVTPINAPNPFLNLSLSQAHATTSLAASPALISTPSSQFPFVPPAPLSSPALHLGVTNPFNQAFSSPPASANTTIFSAGSIPFASSVAVSTPTTPSVQPVMALPTGAALHTPPLGYFPSQTSTPVPTLSFPVTQFAPVPSPAGLSQNPFVPVGAPGQVPLSANVATNPFSAMQVGQAGLSGMTPQMVVLSQQQQQQQLGSTPGFHTWTGSGVHGTF